LVSGVMRGRGFWLMSMMNSFFVVPQTPGGRIRSLGYLVLTRARGRACRNASKAFRLVVPEVVPLYWTGWQRS